MLMLCIYGSCLVWYIKSSATLSWKENLFCLLISGRTENPGISESVAFLCDLTDNNRQSMDRVPAISVILKSMFLCNKKYVKQISSHLWNGPQNEPVLISLRAWKFTAKLLFFPQPILSSAHILLNTLPKPHSLSYMWARLCGNCVKFSLQSWPSASELSCGTVVRPDGKNENATGVHMGLPKKT